MKTLKSVLTGMVVLTTACTSNYYLPTKQNVMTFEKKGDATVSVSASSFSTQMGIEAGYAFTDHVGLVSSLSQFDISYYGPTKLLKDYIWNNEIILYKQFNFGVYTGLNLGYAHGGFNTGNPYYKLSMNRLSVQPGAGYFFSNTFYMAGSVRFSKLNYNLTVLQSNQYSDYDKQVFRALFNLNNIDDNTFVFAEPAFTFGFRTSYFDLQLQYVIAQNNTKKYIPYRSQDLIVAWTWNLDRTFFHPASKTKKLRWTF
jgi:hypothetical protein